MNNKYRVGKKQSRAIVDQDGRLIALFSKGQEKLAIATCDMLNAQQEESVPQEFNKKEDVKYWRCVSDSYDYFDNGVIYKHTDCDNFDAIATMAKRYPSDWQPVTEAEYLAQEEAVKRRQFSHQLNNNDNKKGGQL